MPELEAATDDLSNPTAKRKEAVAGRLGGRGRRTLHRLEPSGHNPAAGRSRRSFWTCSTTGGLAGATALATGGAGPALRLPRLAPSRGRLHKPAPLWTSPSRLAQAGRLSSRRPIRPSTVRRAAPCAALGDTPIPRSTIADRCSLPGGSAASRPSPATHDPDRQWRPVRRPAQEPRGPDRPPRPPLRAEFAQARRRPGRLFVEGERNGRKARHRSPVSGNQHLPPAATSSSKASIRPSNSVAANECMTNPSLQSRGHGSWNQTELRTYDQSTVSA